MPEFLEMPLSLQAITPEWLTTALGRAGHDATVASVEANPMPGIVGAIGEVGVVSVRYDNNASGLPDEFIGKCPLDEDFARMTNEIMQMYRRETGFYQDLAAEVQLQVPTCYVSEADASGNQTLMLLGRGVGADGDILAGTSFANMTQLATDLGTMHGQFFGDQRLIELPWALDWSTPSFDLGIPVVQGAFATMREQEPDAMSNEIWDFLDEGYVNDTRRWLTMMDERAWTLIHGDYELDNMLIQPTPGDGPGNIVVLDWQTVMRTFPGLDLGFFFMTSSNEEAVLREDELVDTYRTALLAAGGPAWSRDDVYNDCAWAIPYHLTGACVSNTTDTSGYGAHGERMAQRFRRMFDGMVAAANRWDAVDRLRGS